MMGIRSATYSATLISSCGHHVEVCQHRDMQNDLRFSNRLTPGDCGVVTHSTVNRRTAVLIVRD